MCVDQIACPTFAELDGAFAAVQFTVLHQKPRDFDEHFCRVFDGDTFTI